MSHSHRPRSARAVYEMHYGPNMTPMVDVVMVILIFFMASAAFLGPEWFLKSSLPVRAAGPASNEKPPTRLTFYLAHQGGTQVRIQIDDDAPTPMTMDEARNALQSRAASGADGLVVLVAPEANVPYDDVVRIHEWCAADGVTKVGILGDKQ
ncbi:MAG: hypothetical protein GC200_09510 [Tepidisphaera sp.]|nr:hypothetical protein [Tepidisphaera sp.]